MASLKDMRVRIASTKSTQKITKAMQMVAAAKLRRAQGRPRPRVPSRTAWPRYWQSHLRRVGRHRAGFAARHRQGPGASAHRLTSERGLCGGFNTQIVRAAREKIAELQGAGKTVKLMAVGKKGRDQLRRLHGDKIVRFVDLSGFRNIGPNASHTSAKRCSSSFNAGEFDSPRCSSRASNR